MKTGWHTGCYLIFGPRNIGKKHVTIDHLKRDLEKPPEGIEVNFDIAPDRVNYVYIIVNGEKNIYKIPVHVGYFLDGEYRREILCNYYLAVEECL